MACIGAKPAKTASSGTQLRQAGCTFVRVSDTGRGRRGHVPPRSPCSRAVEASELLGDEACEAPRAGERHRSARAAAECDAVQPTADARVLARRAVRERPVEAAAGELRADTRDAR